MKKIFALFGLLLFAVIISGCTQGLQQSVDVANPVDLFGQGLTGTNNGEQLPNEFAEQPKDILYTPGATGKAVNLKCTYSSQGLTEELYFMGGNKLMAKIGTSNILNDGQFVYIWDTNADFSGTKIPLIEDSTLYSSANFDDWNAQYSVEGKIIKCVEGGASELNFVLPQRDFVLMVISETPEFPEPLPLPSKEELDSGTLEEICRTCKEAPEFILADDCKRLC